MINLAEEILLIALDDETGDLLPMPVRSLDIALAGGLLMELAFKEKVSITLDGVKVINSEETGHNAMDYALTQIPSAAQDAPVEAHVVLREIAGAKHSLKTMLCDRLTEKNILKKEDEKHFFNLMTKTSYPMIDGKEEYSMRERVRKVVLDEAIIPDSRDIVIVTLISTCKLGPHVFSDNELEGARARIEKIKSMDILGQILSEAVAKVQESIAKIISLSGM